MQCPKCKNEISAQSLKCEKCGTRVATVCKTCGTINPIRATECQQCHTALLKICTECGSANLPDAQFCRKCGVEFVHSGSVPKKTRKTLSVEYQAETFSQQKAKLCL
jgi:ribosomal protein L40E